MGVRLRQARPDDAGALSVFARRVFTDTFGALYRPEDLNTFLSSSYAVDTLAAEIADPRRAAFLAETGAEIVGYAQSGPLALPVAPAPIGVTFELKRLYVDGAWRGAGAADQLMAHVIDDALARGVTALFLGVFCENRRAQRFYERHGFVKVGAYQFPVGAALDDEWIMRKALQA